MNLYVYIIGCCVFVAACLACLKLGYHWGRDDGYAAAEDDRKIARAEARRGRHARTQPRTSLVGSPPALPSEMTPPRPVPLSGDPNRWRTWSPGVSLRSVSAADIAPVVLPAPGAYRPQPSRDSGDGTLTFDKLTDTGAMAALATAEQVADNNAWLEKWSADAVPGV